MPLKLANLAELRAAQAALFNANSTSGWVILSYVSPAMVKMAASGPGGPAELVAQLQDDQIQYALLRLGGIEEMGSSKPTIRDVFISWIGPGVSITENGQKAALLADAQNILQPYHADITVLNRARFDRKTILDKSDPLSSSHVID